VLIVEDEPEALAALARFLSHRGFAVTPASNGGDAVRLCRERGFDVVLTDLRMPGTDGHGLIEQLKEHNPAMPIVVMTGQAGFDRARAPDDGAVAATLHKPLDLRELDALMLRLTKGLERDSRRRNHFGVSARARF